MKIGIIGGTGLYDFVGLHDARTLELDTPFGKPSDAIIAGELFGVEVFFLPRHGRGHRLLPSELPHRANVFAFKKLGVERVIGVSAVGSLREDLRPGDVCLPDQFFDRTKRSEEHTFFGRGVVAHISFAEPTCPDLRHVLHAAAGIAISGDGRFSERRVQNGGTYVNMEGPAFSTRAESFYYRRMGFDVIGMTSLAEAKLCREAEICYASVALVTDYDCWHESEAAVSVEVILEQLRANAGLAAEILRQAIPRLREPRTCACANALKNAIVTRPDLIPPERRQALEPIIGRYLS